MPRYRSHKEVHALKIERCEVFFSHQHRDERVRLHFADDGYAPIEAKFDLIARYKPVQGDYYVAYSDGYVSISPAKAFEEGYTLIS